MAEKNTSFGFSLTDEEKEYLHELVQLSILQGLKQRRGARDLTELPPPPTEKLKQPMGAFVTLKINDNLRGCIGSVVGVSPLHETVATMAQSAAFEDPRFPPLRVEEFESLEIEISVLSPLEPCPDAERVEVGRHGLIVRKGGRSGLLLPQVPLEHGWNRETFLRHTCFKAGLPPDSWRDADAELYWFEAVVF